MGPPLHAALDGELPVAGEGLFQVLPAPPFSVRTKLSLSAYLVSLEHIFGPGSCEIPQHFV